MSKRRNPWIAPTISGKQNNVAETPSSVPEIKELALDDEVMGNTTRLARPPLERAGMAANRAAARGVFEEYRERLATNTIKRQRAGIEQFSRYLQDAGVAADAERLWQEPDAWVGITWGLVKGFVRWLLQEGYATGTINVRLATIRSYAKLAAQAGAIAPDDLGLILTVKGYSRKQGRNIDAQRAVTRVGEKKVAPVRVSEEEAAALKRQPDTPQGRRDALLMCLLLEHGLRVGEVAELKTKNIDLQTRTMTFYRRKVDETQTHKLSADTLRAAWVYLEQDAHPAGQLLRGSRKSGELAGSMSVRAIRQRVRALGEQIGIDRLSPHDCRHYWATYWAPRVSIKQLQKAGGWSSPTMPLHYAKAAEIANEGMA